MRHLVKIPLKSPHPQSQPFTFLIVYQSLPYVTKKPIKWKFTSPYKSSLIAVVNILELDLVHLRLCMVFNLEELSMYVLLRRIIDVRFTWDNVKTSEDWTFYVDQNMYPCILKSCKKVFLHLPPKILRSKQIQESKIKWLDQSKKFMLLGWRAP